MEPKNNGTHPPKKLDANNPEVIEALLAAREEFMQTVLFLLSVTTHGKTSLNGNVPKPSGTLKEVADAVGLPTPAPDEVTDPEVMRSFTQAGVTPDVLWGCLGGPAAMWGQLFRIASILAAASGHPTPLLQSYMVTFVTIDSESGVLDVETYFQLTRILYGILLSLSPAQLVYSPALIAGVDFHDFDPTLWGDLNEVLETLAAKINATTNNT